jgi:hypothetical protein
MDVKFLRCTTPAYSAVDNLENNFPRISLALVVTKVLYPLQELRWYQFPWSAKDLLSLDAEGNLTCYLSINKSFI